jgi:antirestriction protein ArdC
MKSDIRDEIAARFIEALNAGKIPWRMPWKGTNARPRNAFTQRPYRGVNSLYLGLLAMNKGYASGEWMTLNQCHKAGGRVVDAEFRNGVSVLFWKFIKKEDAQGNVSTFPLCRSFTVYNRAQTEGLPEVVTETVTFEPIAAAQAIVDGMKNAPKINIIESDSAHYAPSLDTVTMPLVTQFHNAAGYYATLFHELSHSTGHKSRLGRDGVMESKGMGSDSYSKEELIAEVSAAFLGAECGILDQIEENSKAYVQGWASKLGKEPRLIIEAAAAAQKATDCILGYSYSAPDAD